MVTRALLPLDFDPQPLRAETEALPPDAWVPHFNTAYYEGDWSGVALRSVGGRDQQLYPDPAAADPFADTPTLGRCPRLAGALHRFECALLSARLLRLGREPRFASTATTRSATTTARSASTYP